MQGEVNTAVEELLKVRVSMDHCSGELDLGVEMAVYLNDAQLTEAKACHAATAVVLHKTHLDSISALNHEVADKEGQNAKPS